MFNPSFPKPKIAGSVAVRLFLSTAAGKRKTHFGLKSFKELQISQLINKTSQRMAESNVLFGILPEY